MTDPQSPSSIPLQGNGGEIAVTAALELVRDALRGLKYGMISLIVQDGVVVQLERLEKRRLRKPGT